MSYTEVLDLTKTQEGILNTLHIQEPYVQKKASKTFQYRLKFLVTQ
jgi:hypothetical protein